MRYSVCIATFRRPEGLTKLLESLEAQILPEGAELEVIVVDNDPPTAAPVVDAYRQKSKHVVLNGEQSAPNISLTRNASVALATGDWVWFVDDDEWVEPDCLMQLVAAIDSSNADVAFGDVRPEFESPVPHWIETSTIFARRTPTDFAESVADRTGNTLVRRSILTSHSGPFAEELGLSGGEDSDLFDRVRFEGHRLVETSKAVAWESVPEDRANWPWMVERWRRLGRLYSERTLRSAGGAVTDVGVMAMFGKAVAQTAAYGALSVVSWPKLETRKRFQERFHLNVGKLSALTGGSIKSPWSS